MSARAVLLACSIFALSLAGSAKEAAPTPTPPVPAEERTIELHNTHTGDTVRVVFKRGDQYDAASLEQLNKILVDHRSGETHSMDPGLFDQLFDLARAAGVEPSYEIISGYRSPESNSKMAAKPGSGVSKKSLHMQGRAMDVRLKGCTVEKLRDLALAARRGGVGYYQRSQFVHIDTGSFRTWIG
jgi:uncharacterized protein YcbK (DUF882 family)